MEYTDQAEDLLRSIIKELDKYPAYVSKDFTLCVNSYLKETGAAGLEVLDSITKLRNIYAQIYIWSARLWFKHDYQDVKTLLQLVNSTTELSFYNRYFLYYQIQNYIFTNPDLDTEEMFILKETLLKTILSELSTHIKLPTVNPMKADSNMVIVVASQILSTDHAPTKTALDRCAVIKKTGRKVMLINTAETFSGQGRIPFYAEKEGTYNEELSNRSSINWLGEDIPYFQCDNNMPDPAQMEMLIHFLIERKPGLVISIGGTGLFAGLCAKYFPVLTVSLYPSSLEPALSQYQTLGRKLRQEDVRLLKELGRDTDYVIEGEFTYSFKPQFRHLTRRDFALDENDFVTAVIGSRLEAEVTPEFISMLDKISIPSMKVLFIGGFNGFDDFMIRNGFDQDRYRYAGYADDVLAVLELCDLYVNPLRKGGGSSALEALYKGVPVITPPYGDVSVNVGNDFCTSKEQIPELIEKYYNDSDFYSTMSEKGRIRVDSLLNRNDIFEGILNEVFSRQGKNEI